MAAQPLFRCYRLNAAITRAACEKNKNGRSIFACDGCSGLGAMVDIKVEVTDMSSKCKVKGCVKTSQKGKNGMCIGHFKDYQVAGTKLRAPVSVVAKVTEHKEKPTNITPEKTECLAMLDTMLDDFTVTDTPKPTLPDEVIGTDLVIMLALQEAWAAKQARWLSELFGLKPGQTIMRTVRMIDALDGLGY